LIAHRANIAFLAGLSAVACFLTFMLTFTSSEQDFPARHIPAQEEKGRKMVGRKMILPSMILPFFWLSAPPR
jgi:hypothetical protein